MKKAVLSIIILVLIGMSFSTLTVEQSHSKKTEAETPNIGKEVLFKNEESASELNSKKESQASETPKQILFDLEKQFLELTDKEIKLKIKAIENSVKNERMLERANSNTLTQSERSFLAEALRSQNVMKLVLIKRKIEKIKKAL